MNDLFRPGSPFTAWVVGMAILFAVVEFVNPAIWYSADVLGTARVIAATGGAAAAAPVGALLGAVIGLIASMMAAKKPVPADRKAVSRALVKARSRNGYIVLGCVVASAAFAAYNLTFTSEKASFVACTTIQHDLDAAQGSLSGSPATSIARANDALGRSKGCNGSYGGSLVSGALYFLRGAAYLQTDLLPDRANKDFNRAAALIKDCRIQYAGTDKAQMCETYLAADERYRTQHFCDDTLALATRADNELYSNPAASKADAQRGIASAAKCKNVASWAYRAVALAQRAQAEVRLGQPAAATVAEADRLLGRCVGQLGGRVLSECKAAQKVVAQAKAGRTTL
jgi:hypothetical protein